MNSMTNTTWQSHLDETKRGLARLLARENLIVRHADVETASFDLERRTLTLPKWTNITVDQYDLLIGHEVGHALYSDDVEAVTTAQQFPGLHTYINVLEDVRIERRIKDEFPGLRGSFTRGYRDFFEKGPIFQLDRPVEQYDFIDRINIHYKLGAHIDVPFTDVERSVLARLDKCRTMQEIVALARELWAGQKQQNEQQQTEQQQTEQQQTEQQQNGAGDAHPPQSNSGDAQEASDGSDEDEDGATASSTTEVSAEQDDASSSDDTADAPATADGAAPQTTQTSVTDPVAETDQQNRDAISRLDRESQTEYSVSQIDLAPLPATVVTTCTVDNATFVRDALQHLTHRPARLARATTALATFQTKYGSTIAHMAREFDRRKSAKLHERARTARTGRLDLTKLASYKFREDLFQQVTVLPNGKSHGIVLLIDGSGSMVSVLGDVIEQVMLFTQFAQRVNIPVQAYLFHDAQVGEQLAVLESIPAHAARPTSIELVCLYDSTRKNLKAQQTVLAALHQMFHWSVDRSFGAEIRLPHVKLTMTPLHGALLLVERHLAALKQTLRLEKMSLIVLTDGDATDHVIFQAAPGGAAIYRDTVTRQVYAALKETRDWQQTPLFVNSENSDGYMLVDSIRRRHAARVVRIHIAKPRVLRAMAKLKTNELAQLDELFRSSLRPVTEGRPGVAAQLGRPVAASLVESLRAQEQCVLSHAACFYDALLVVSSSSLDLNDDDAFSRTNTRDWSSRKIATAFTKANVKAMKSRVFVNAMVPFLV